MGISIDLSPFLIKIWVATAGELKHLHRPKPRIEQLKEASDELNAKEADINSSISQAEREGKIPTKQIQQWVSKVKEMEGKVEATEKDFDRMRCLCGWSWNCFSVNRRVAKRMDKINKLKTGVNDIPVAKKPPPLAVEQILTSNSTVGMDANLKEILGRIANTNAAGVIGVYGMGGVGKTTLLRSINNHRDVEEFDHVIWAVASKECKMKRLQKDIAKRLDLRLEEDDSDDNCATKLFNYLRNKNCLLLLDDLWEPLDLAKLGMAQAPSGQGDEKRKVVVFTTRNEKVCGGMKASKKMEIKCLEQEQAWELFQMNADEDAIRSDPHIQRIARQIAKECAGLPLAIITVGKAMSTKKSWQAWSDALTLMQDSQVPKVTGTEKPKKPDPIFSAFILSYDSLEDDEMRGRLLSCAIWPEDFSIKNEELIECWMGLGLINEVGAIYKAYNRGHSHIETLKAACLLEPGNDEEREVKMHDVIRDMALWMASDYGKTKFKWIVRAGVANSQALEEEGWHEAERASLMYNDIASLPNRLSICSKLSMLMLRHSYKLKEIRGTLIQAMRSMTYLDLERTRITELPKEIGMLTQLQHLNLSSTPIKELPTELGCLIKLNYLFLRDTSKLTIVIKGTISNLSSLRLLDLRGSGYVDCWDELDGLKGCHKSIGIDITTEAALQHLCLLQHVSTWRLNVKILSDSTNLKQLLDNVISGCNIRQSMEQLRIEDVDMDELLISEGNKATGGLQCLKYLEFKCLHLLREITWKEVQPQTVFPNLRELIISGCQRLRHVNWALQLPSLSILDISFCKVMEELISDESYSSSSNFGLRKMTLYGNYRLKRISARSLFFPYLEDIEVLCCPLLVKLPFENQISVKRLKVIQCEQTWWDNLEWEDVTIKHSLSPLVRRSKHEGFALDMFQIYMEEQAKFDGVTFSL